MNTDIINVITRFNEQGQESSCESGSHDDLARALAALGIDPTTVSREPAPEPELSPQERVAKLIADHLANDLTDAESHVLAHAMWIALDSESMRRTREAWRVCSFIVLHDVKASALPAEIMPAYMHTSGPSSVIHRWTSAGVWSRAAGKLDALPFREWSKERRETLAKLVEWESRLRDKSERRKAEKIFEATNPKQGRKKTR